jgi:methionyl-tRNA synthetase
MFKKIKEFFVGKPVEAAAPYKVETPALYSDPIKSADTTTAPLVQLGPEPTPVAVAETPVAVVETPVAVAETAPAAKPKRAAKPKAPAAPKAAKAPKAAAKAKSKKA